MEIKEQNLREQVNALADHGLKMKWISEQTNISESFLCRWRHNTDYYNLNTKKRQALKAFLDTYK